MSRPEAQAPAAFFYNEEEARRYATNNRMMQIQTTMSERAIELLNLPNQPCLLLDIGCGSGLSGEVLTEQEHTWVGIDISLPMLTVAKERGAQGDLVHQDVGEGFCFVPGIFDGAISISVLQWLCNAEKSDHVPFKRLCCLFESLYEALKRGARAIFQFYPNHPQQIEMITQAAVKSGFSSDMVIDFPNSAKAKKYYLILYSGTPQELVQMPHIESEDHVPILKRKKKYGFKNKTHKVKVKSKEWIAKKKERQEKQGKDVRHFSKYMGRKRKPKF